MSDDKDRSECGTRKHGGGAADGESGGDRSEIATDVYRELAASRLDKRLAEFEEFLTAAVGGANKRERSARAEPARAEQAKPIVGADASAKKRVGDPKRSGNIHAGHRARMRKTVSGDPTLEALSDIEVLEYILAHAVPYKDTNPLAHALLDRFGSLAEVFAAPESEMIKIPDMTRNAARLLGLLPRTCESGGVREMDGSEHFDMLSFALSLFVGSRERATFVAYFDERFGLAAVEKSRRSDKPTAYMDLRRDIAGSVCKYGAKYVLAASRDNDLFPNMKSLGREIENIGAVLDAVGARLYDYIVVSDLGYYTLGSAAKRGGADFIFIPVQAFARAPELVTRILENTDE